MHSLQDITQLHRQYPLINTINIDTFHVFLMLLYHMKPILQFTLRSDSVHHTPRFLPRDIQLFIMEALKISEDLLSECWSAFREVSWHMDCALPPDPRHLIPLFLEHGPANNLGVYHLYPPTRRCNMAGCPAATTGSDLGEARTSKAILFSRDYGALPILTTSLYCRGCFTRYHHNCFVSNGIRTYYRTGRRSHDQYIQISSHYFCEAALCEKFINQMVHAWTSAQNCARLYNMENEHLPWKYNLPGSWALRFEIDDRDVWEAFTVYVLLQWNDEHGTTLSVPHKAADPQIRWFDAVQARNVALSGAGQPAWNHACDVCTKHILDEDGHVIAAFRSVITDGISLGHPCCSVQDCKQLLQNNRDRFCKVHESMNTLCAVESCSTQLEPGYRTCSLPEHRNIETRYQDRSKAMFQLKERLKRTHRIVSRAQNKGLPNPGNTEVEFNMEEEDDEAIVDDQGEVIEDCDDKPMGGLRKVHARFGRRRTHNEELCVASCGVILGRATFFGAEGPNSVRIFWKELFPTQASLPSVMWYDNNCKVSAMLAHDGDTYFDQVALPVDVFHFKSKHKEKDQFCGQNCNPALWPQLMDEKTKQWVFNSSAAEMVNLWFSGFRSMTRLMRSDRYNFFLDEAILRRNKFIIEKLDHDGQAPYLIPRDDLLVT